MRAWRGVAIAGLALGILLAGGTVRAQAPELVLTLYGQGFALVEERRQVELPQGEASLRLEGVARRLQPDTVALSGAGIDVLELRAETRPLARQTLLEAAVGRTVLVVRQHPRTGETMVEEAELLSVAEGPVLRLDGRIETEPAGRIALPGLPDGLHPDPAIAARLAVADAGMRPLTLTYLTEGLAWEADYTARLADDGETLALTGLASLVNDSGAGYAGATVRLVAGQVNRPEADPPQPRQRAVSAMAEAAAAPMPEERAVADVHRYDLPRAVSLADGERVQVPLVAAEGVAFERRYRLQGLATAAPQPDRTEPSSASVRLDVENAEAAGLGRPLPAGVVRVYAAGADGGLFLGGDRIEHTPEDGTLKLSIGAAFDVTGWTRLTDYERIGERTYEVAREVTVHNARDRAVTVEVVGSFPRDWRMLRESHGHELESQQQPVWPLEVPAGGETTLAYRVRVSR